MDVLFREMSRKWIKPSSNLLTVKHVRFIWFVHQQHIFKITSIKLLIYKATVKHFTNNIIFEFCHDKKKKQQQWPNEEPNKMPSIWLLSALLINLVLINLLSLTPKKPIWTTVRACCQGLLSGLANSNSSWSENKVFSFHIYTGEYHNLCGWWWCIELCLTNPFHFLCFYI